MSMKLLSRGETNENNSFNNPKIEGEEQLVNENAFETEYLIEYDIEVSTPKNSLAKTYENKNEMIAILEVPKSDYKNENIQKLLKWARTRVREDNYYRDIAVYVQVAEKFERSIVFTHAEISINEETYIKSDFVTMTVRINQKRDKFAGVMFGDNIDNTYRKAWQKVLNPPRLNIYIPNKANDNKEFAFPIKDYNTTKELVRLDYYDYSWKEIKKYYDGYYGKNIKSFWFNFKPHNSNNMFFYSDGPEEIDGNKTKQCLLKFLDEKKKEKFLFSKEVDFEFYHKVNSNEELSFCIIAKNESEKEITIKKIKNVYDDMNVIDSVKENGFADEKNKEEMCANVQLKFHNSNQKEIIIENDEIKETDIVLSKNEVKIISQFNLSSTGYKRMYGRTRIECDKYKYIKARTIVLPTKDIKPNSYDALWEIQEEEKSGTGQFTGVINYKQIDVSITNMSKKQYFILTDRSDVFENGEFQPDNEEYPAPIYAKSDGYKYFFGNFGIIYKITLSYPSQSNYEGTVPYNKFPLADKGKIIRVYPFGHNYAKHSIVLIKTSKNGKWIKSKHVGPCDDADNFNWLQKSSFDIELNGNTFYFMLSGGNCGIYKFVMY